MELRKHSRRLLACAIGVLATVGASGLACAAPDPSPPPAPSIIDQLLTTTPVLSVGSGDDGDGSVPWGGVGMFCQNLSVRCR